MQIEQLNKCNVPWSIAKLLPDDNNYSKLGKWKGRIHLTEKKLVAVTDNQDARHRPKHSLVKNLGDLWSFEDLRLYLQDLGYEYYVKTLPVKEVKPSEQIYKYQPVILDIRKDTVIELGESFPTYYDSLYYIVNTILNKYERNKPRSH